MSSRKDVVKTKTTSGELRKSTHQKRDKEEEKKKLTTSTTTKDVGGVKKSVVKKSDSEIQPSKLKTKADVKSVRTKNDKKPSATNSKEGLKKKTSSSVVGKPKSETVNKKGVVKKTSSSSTNLSSRVTRSEYYPSKQMIHNVVSTAKKQQIEVEDGDNSISESSTISNLERPKTATLRKGSIVNKNIVGPEAPKNDDSKSKSKPSTKEFVQQSREKLKNEEIKSTKNEDKEEEEYEDDFDSYESDFEEYSPSGSSSSISEELSDDAKKSDAKQDKLESEEERKMDSGNFEMPEYKHKHILDNIRESIEQENNGGRSNSNLTSLSDEGFVETNNGVPFINFVEAQRKFKQKKSAERRRKRGEELTNLIKLDTQSFSLLEMEPVSYPDFIRLFGNSNTSQISTQTGDDDVNEEVQTMQITSEEKWTQFPPTPIFHPKMNLENEIDKKEFRQSVLGVGISSSNNNSKSNTLKIKEDEDKEALERFLNATSKLILNLLNERTQYSLGNINGISDVPFSNGFVDFNTSKNILDNYQAKSTFFSSSKNEELLLATLHTLKKLNDDDKNAATSSKICIWNIYNTEEPQRIISCYGNATCCSFAKNNEYLLTGFSDGNISCYNLILNNLCALTPIKSAHLSPVISIQVIKNFNDEEQEQICSCEQEGTLILWVLIKETLIKNSVIVLTQIHPDLDALICRNMNVNLSSTHIFVSTNYGYIIHCLPNNSKPVPNRFINNEEVTSEVTCLSICPFSSDYFIVGCENGSLYLYSTSITKCLKTLTNKAEGEENKKIEFVEWSQTKPFVFYVKDEENNIHVWDLESSDLFPIYTIPFREDLVHMKLAPYHLDCNKQTKNNKRAYMVVVTKEGAIHLHLLNSEHGPQTIDKYQQDVKMFYKYVNRL